MEIFTLNSSCRQRSEFTRSWLCLLAVFGFLLTSQMSMAQYCTPVFENGCAEGDMIKSLTVQPLGYSHVNTGCSTNAYGDFTTSEEFPDLQAGETYTFVVTHDYQTQNVRVWIDLDDDGTFTDSADSELVGLASSTGTGTATTTSVTVTIPLDADLGEHRLRIGNRFSSQPIPCNLLGYGEAHDYTVTILAANPCLAPTLPMVDGVTSETATISWTSAGTSFDVEWGAPGFVMGGGTLISGITTNSAVISGLVENTAYQFYVRNNCGAGSLSSWVGPINFFTGYCIPPASSFTGYIINNVTTTEGYTNISNSTGTTASAAYYGNFTDMAVLQSEGGEFTYNVTVPGYTNLEIWIDYNDNLIFDTDELVGQHVYGTVATTFTGSVVIPDGTENGDYRMRIRSRYYFNTTASPCAAASYGETEDYTLSVVDAPTCIPPTSLSAEDITMESAVLAWESDGTLFDVEWGVAPFAQGEGEMINNIANQYVLGDLDPDTSYQFYVSRDCGAGGNSFWAGPFTFFTGYCAVSTANTSDYTSAFSTNGAVANVAYSATSQPAGSYANATSQVIEHPQGMPFNFSTTFVGGGQTVNVWIDWDNNLIFDNETGSTEKVFSNYSTSLTQTGTITVPEDIEPGSYRVRVRSQWGSGSNPPPCGSVSYGSTIDFTLEVLPAPTCFPPTALGVEDITQGSAVLTWESDGTLFDIEYGQAPFEIGEGVPVNGITNQYALSGLDPDTAYQYYVRTDCGAVDGESYWAGPFNFFTGYCVPGASTSTGYIINAVSTVGGYTNIMNTTGNTPSTASYGNFSEDMAVSQSPGGEFSYNVSVPAYTNVEIWADLNQDFIFATDELIGAHVYASSATTFTGTIVLPDDIALGEYRVRVRSRYYFNTTASACGAAQYGETEDYTLSVVAPPACMPPTDLSVEDITLDSAILVWEADGNLFDIEHGEAPFALGDGTTVSGVTNEYLLTGLESDTSYQFYVRQDCGVEGKSFWAGPFTFLTGYCAVSTTYNADYTSAFSTSGAVSNVTYTATAQAPGSYSNQTENVIGQAQGLSFNFSTTYVGGGQTVNIWVDWDGDLNFDNATGSAEKLFSAYTENATQTGTIAIPDDIAPGTYRMRVRSQWGTGANPPPCGNVSYGSTIDYTLEVLPAPSCFPPTGLSVENITMDSADISWESDGTLFDIEYGQAPFAVGEGIAVNDIAGDYSLTGLDSDTMYQFYVRQDCGSGETSFWSGPFSFFTGYCAVSTTYDYDYTSAFSTNGAIANVTYTATAQPAGSYSNQTDTAIEQVQGEAVNFSTTYVGGGQTVNIWVDWNNDMVLDNSVGSTEKVYSNYSAGATQTGSIMIPADTEPGSYRVRVRSLWGTGANPAPCGSVSYGSTLDFTLEVLDALSTVELDQASLKLYPNPVKDMLNLSYKENISNVEVFNLLGQQVIVKTINAAQGQIDMSNLAAGTYLVKVTADKAVKTLKVIKQ